MKIKNKIKQTILMTSLSSAFIFSGLGVSAMAEDSDLKLTGCEGKMVLWEGYDTDNVTLTISGGAADSVSSNDISWRIADGGESIATVTPASDGLNAVLKGVGVGTTQLVVTVDGVGTVSAPVYVGRMQPGAFGFTDGLTYTYTGEEIKPRFEVTAQAGDFLLVEGKDYTLTYENNINCGVARLLFDTIEEENEPDHLGTQVSEFLITPGSTLITAAGMNSTSVMVSVKDQKSTGISGYKVEYREEGVGEWNSKIFSPDTPELTIDGLEAGKNYEVRACSFVNVPKDSSIALWLESQYFGEYSDIKLIHTTSEKKENPSDAEKDKNNEASGESGDNKENSSVTAEDKNSSASKKTGNDDTPDTGDKNNMSAYIVAAGFSAAAIVIMVIYWMKMKRE